MRYWIDFVSRHHNIGIISNNQIKIPNIGYDASGKWFDHIITAHEGHYSIEERHHDTGDFVTAWNETSIKEYLGY